MKRRDFIKYIGSSALSFPISSLMATQQSVQSSNFSNWTSYRLTFQVDLPDKGSSARLWLPLPDTNDPGFQFTQGSNWNGNATKASFSTIGTSAFPIFKAEWQGKQKGNQRHITVSCIVKTSNHSFDLGLYPASKNSALPSSIKNYLNPTHLKPTNGIVRETVHSIIRKGMPQ